MWFGVAVVSDRPGVKLEAQSFHDFHDSRELGIASAGEGFIQTFASEAGAAGYLGHALGAGNIVESGVNQKTITRIVFKAGLSQLLADRVHEGIGQAIGAGN